MTVYLLCASVVVISTDLRSDAGSPRDDDEHGNATPVLAAFRQASEVGGAKAQSRALTGRGDSSGFNPASL